MKIVGHRGFPAEFPENSLRGIEAAYTNGAHGVEIDVQFSRDGIPLLFHDDDLSRVTGMPGKVHLYDAEVLQKISAHEPERFALAHLPSPIAKLEQAIPIVQKFSSGVFFIELKEEAFQSFSREFVVAAVHAIIQPALSQCVIISYDLAVLRVARDEFDLTVGWVLENYDDSTQMIAADFQPEYLICNFRKLPKQQPLWSGLWEWFIYDIVDPEQAAFWHGKGVGWIETWNVKQLTPNISSNISKPSEQTETI